MQDMMKQWMDMNRSLTASFAEITKANSAIMNEMMQHTMGTRQFAEFVKSMLDSGKEMESNREEAANKLLQSMLGSVDLQAGSTALKELGEINSSAMTRLVQNQMEVLNTYIETTSEHMEKLKAAKSTDDLMGAQMHLFTELQEKMKANTMNTMQIMNGIKTAMQGWTEKTLEKATAEPAGKSES